MEKKTNTNAKNIHNKNDMKKKVNYQKQASEKKNAGTDNKLIKAIKKHKKVLIMLTLLCVIIYVLIIVVQLFQNPTDTFLVEQGKIYQEEPAIAYVVRNETVLKGENYKNGMSQIKTEGERVAKGEAIFRYYSNGEEGLVKKIQELDKKIDEAMANENDLFSSDTKVLENQILDKLDHIYGESDLQKIKEAKKDINTYVTKKAKIAGDLSPAGSYLKKLIDQRSGYENSLNKGAEYLKSPTGGIVSYRVDGLEDVLNTDDFGTYTKDFLQKLNLKTGQIVAASNESGKIIDNYQCYLVSVLDSDNAKNVEVGDRVKLRLPSGSEVTAEIVYINAEDNDDYVLTFKIEKCVEELISYRKISFSVIWWSESGKKVPNTAIAYETKGENKVAYVVRTRAGYQDKIFVKVLASNEKYSIVANYTAAELEALGYNSEEIKSKKSITLYDEILLSP